LLRHTWTNENRLYPNLKYTHITKFFCESKNGNDVRFLFKEKKTLKILFCKSSELALGPKILEVFLLTLWPHNEAHQEVFSTIPQTDERKTGRTNLLKATVKDPIDGRDQSTPDRFVSFYIKTCIFAKMLSGKSAVKLILDLC